LVKERLLAHSRNSLGMPHFLSDHLQDVSEMAERFAVPFHGGRLADMLGRLHDAGKVQPEFQAYLLGETSRGPNHAWVGALLAEKLGIGPVVLAISGHHAGLQVPQVIKTYQRSSEKQKVLDGIHDSLKKLFPDLKSVAKQDWPSWISLNLGTQEVKRRFELLVRFLFSCLVDADFLNTENHFYPDIRKKRKAASFSIEKMWRSLKAAQKEFEGKSGQLNQKRKEIYDACIKSASLSPGFFRLTVQTGGGKTRSGLAFALKHAKYHDLKRVIVAIPYTSIIEQTAAVYRGIFGAANVLEHHSAIPLKEDEASEINDHLKLAAENWDASLIVTTTVQFFESLFSNRTSRCRKLHNIASSVIVLDEIQTLPVELLEPTLDVLSELVQHYGVTVVFCTATQPAFEYCFDFFLEGIENVREIVLSPGTYFHELKRVNYHMIDEPLTLEGLAFRVMAQGNQSLCIFNSKRDALEFTQVLQRESDVNKQDVFHLSTNLCGAHRYEVLKEVGKRTRSGNPCFLVSTQVVEAGVDLDFPVVFRAVGPLDRIVQAAGRCNRENGLPEHGNVFIFRLQKEHSPKGIYKTASHYAEQFLKGAHDLNLPGTFKDYFRGLYDMAPLDANAVQACRAKFDFPETAFRYRLIRGERFPVSVRYGEAKEQAVDLVNRLQMGFEPPAELWRQLQPYLVNLSKYELEKALKEHWVVQIKEGLWYWAGRYDDRLGLLFEPPDPEDNII